MKECSGKKLLKVKVAQNDPLDSSSQKIDLVDSDSDYMFKKKFISKQALQKFSEAARWKYLTNEDKKVTICHFEFKISEFEKKRQ